MGFLQTKRDLPSRSRLIVWSEFIELTGTTPERIIELIDIGWIAPIKTAKEVMLFGQEDVYRLRKLERICIDFDINTVGGSIIIDLLDRVSQLEKQIKAVTEKF